MTDPLDAATKQAADVYWGAGQQQRPAKHDVHGIGDPPRVLTDNMRRYIEDGAANLFGLLVGAAVLVTIMHVVMIAATGNLWMPPVLPLAFIVLAIVSGKRRADMRRRLTRVLTDGAITGAVVRNIHQTQHRRAVTTTVSYRVEGTSRDVHVVSGEQGLAFLQIGLRDEVVFLPSEPDIVVPTFLLA